jgi:hypothetical protein
MYASGANASLQSLIFRVLGNIHIDLLRDGKKRGLVIDHILQMMRAHDHAAAVQSSACRLLFCLCEGGKEAFCWSHAGLDASRSASEELVAVCVRSRLGNSAYLKDSSAIALVLDALRQHAGNAEVQTHALQLVRVLFRFSELHENVTAPHSHFVELTLAMIRGQPVYPSAYADAAEALCAIASASAASRAEIVRKDGVRYILERLMSDSEAPCNAYVERVAVGILGTAAALAVDPAGKLRLLCHGALGVVLGVLGKFEESVDVHTAASSILARCIAGDDHSRRILGSLGAVDRLLAASVRFQSDGSCCGGLLTVIASISSDSQLITPLLDGLSSQTMQLLGKDGVLGFVKRVISHWSKPDSINPQVVIAAICIVRFLGAEQRAKARPLGMVCCLANLLGFNAGEEDCPNQLALGTKAPDLGPTGPTNAHLMRHPIIRAVFEALKELIDDAENLAEFIACGCIDGVVQLLLRTPAPSSGDDIHIAGFALLGQALATGTASGAPAQAHAEPEADLLAIQAGRKFVAAGGLKAVQLAIQRCPRNARLQRHVCDVLERLFALQPFFSLEMGAGGIVRDLKELEVQDPTTAEMLAVIIARIQTETSHQRQKAALPALLALPMKLRR